MRKLAAIFAAVGSLTLSGLSLTLTHNRRLPHPLQCAEVPDIWRSRHTWTTAMRVDNDGKRWTPSPDQ